jgi:hypothetical protein
MNRQQTALDNFSRLLGDQRFYTYMVDNKEETNVKPYMSSGSLKYPIYISKTLDLSRNNEKSRYGAFIAVNTFHIDKIDFKRSIGRTYTNLKEIRAFTADIDAPKEEGLDMAAFKQDRLAPLFSGEHPEPSAVVETKNGYHVWWILDTPYPVFAENMQMLRALQEKVVDIIGGDAGAKDLPRVLRVPETLHLKSDPFTVKVVHCIGTTYSFEEILKAFPIGDTAKKREAKDVIPLLINIPEGKRNDTAKNILCSVMGSLKPPLWPFFAKAGIREWNKNLTNPLNDDELMTTYGSIASLAINNWWEKDKKGIWTKKI